MDKTPALSTPSQDRRVLDHAASEPESPKSGVTRYDRELERLATSRTMIADQDPINRAIRENPTRAMLVAGGIGFVMALLVR
jgi:hypothetical protein